MKTLVLGDVNFTYLLEIINYELSTFGVYVQYAGTKH